MREEFEVKLIKEFPFMRREIITDATAIVNNPEIFNNLYKSFGCDCDVGWYELIRELCTAITDKYEEYGVPIDIVVDQIKEKGGLLRFYYSFDGEQDGVVSKKLRDDIQQIVYTFECKSLTVCEACGKTGVLRKELVREQTLCDDCYVSYLSRGHLYKGGATIINIK